jgi:hypothetical protein
VWARSGCSEMCRRSIVEVSGETVQSSGTDSFVPLHVVMDSHSTGFSTPTKENTESRHGRVPLTSRSSRVSAGTGPVATPGQESAL